MYTCVPNLRFKFLTNCEIITFKVGKKVFSHVAKRVSSILRAKKFIFGSKYELWLFTFLFLGELGIFLCNFYPHRTYKTYRNAWSFTWRYAESQIQRHVFDNKKGMFRVIGLGIRTVRSCLGTSSTFTRNKTCKKVKSQFLVNSQSFCDLIDFGQILRIKEHILQFGQFWADF